MRNTSLIKVQDYGVFVQVSISLHREKCNDVTKHWGFFVSKPTYTSSLTLLYSPAELHLSLVHMKRKLFFLNCLFPSFFFLYRLFHLDSGILIWCNIQNSYTWLYYQTNGWAKDHVDYKHWFVVVEVEFPTRWHLSSMHLGATQKYVWTSVKINPFYGWCIKNLLSWVFYHRKTDI